MPFLGVLGKRAGIFAGHEPRADVGVSDAEAWRLNPYHRYVYDKLFVALSQGLMAAPAGVLPGSFGIAADAAVFVRPLINLAGMGLGARQEAVSQLSCAAGEFWCEVLSGEHVSSDCLMRDGQCLWFAHTLASAQKHRQRPLLWSVGVDRPALEPGIRDWLQAHLSGYTGLCNVETIAGTIIEAHLRGSNGFFEFYGDDFFNAWVSLVDAGQWPGSPAQPHGFVHSVFVDEQGPLPVDADALRALAAPGCELDVELSAAGYPTLGRVAVVRGREQAAVLATVAAINVQLGIK